MALLRSLKTYPHGDNRRYVFNRCRCPECIAAHTQEARDRRRAIAYGTHRGYVDATGLIRRLRALVTDGHSGRHIAAHLQVDVSWVRALYRGDHRQVRQDTADLFAELYRRLEGIPGPSERARQVAGRRGWHGCDAWDETTIDDPHAQPFSHLPDPETIVDWVAVERALAGIQQPLNRRERHYAVHVGQRRGMTHNAIALAIGVSLSTARVLASQPLPEDCEVAA